MNLEYRVGDELFADADKRNGYQLFCPLIGNRGFYLGHLLKVNVTQQLFAVYLDDHRIENTAIRKFTDQKESFQEFPEDSPSDVHLLLDSKPKETLVEGGC